MDGGGEEALSVACGNGVCDNDETCSTCPADCGSCCGNGVCDNDVTCSTCPADCGPCCGNGVCDNDETCSTCPADCGACCGNTACDNGETCWTCPADCGECVVKIEKGSFWVGSPEGCPVPAGYPRSCGSELGRGSDEKLRYVKLTHDFEMQVHKVTQGEWKQAFGEWNPSFFRECGDTCPVENISWYDACAYANWRSEQAGLPPCYMFSGVNCEDGSDVGLNYKKCLNATKKGIDAATVTLAEGVSKPYDCKGFRLPTEAEWEYAARGGV